MGGLKACATQLVPDRNEFGPEKRKRAVMPRHLRPLVNRQSVNLQSSLSSLTSISRSTASSSGDGGGAVRAGRQARNGFSSAVGPYTDGTDRSSSRR
jgi:hypothetical protein